MSFAEAGAVEEQGALFGEPLKGDGIQGFCNPCDRFGEACFVDRGGVLEVLRVPTVFFSFPLFYFELLKKGFIASPCDGGEVACAVFDVVAVDLGGKGAFGFFEDLEGKAPHLLNESRKRSIDFVVAVDVCQKEPCAAGFGAGSLTASFREVFEVGR